MLNQDYKDILSIFSDVKVEYLLVGAYALAVHGLPRATGDMDLWIRREEANVKRLIRALKAFGAPLTQIAEQDFLTEGIVYQIGVAPRRVDILTSIEGVEFDDAWTERKLVVIEGIAIPVISKKHLLQNKRSTGRKQDAADVSRLEGLEEE